MDIAVQQNNAFQALLYVKEICEEIGVDYYLLAGGVLGAVRHKGFIPWDDDIDLGIKLCDIPVVEAALREKLSHGYVYVSYRYDPDFPRLQGKVLYHGRTVMDIFPLAKVSDNSYVRKFQWFLKKVTRKLYFRKCNYKAVSKLRAENEVLVFLSGVASIFISKKLVLRLNEWNISLFENKNTRNYCNFLSVYSMEKEMIPAIYIEKPSEIEFNGQKFQTVGNVDKYLKNLYGDYMKLPPVEKRIPAHEEVFPKYADKSV